MKQVLTLLIVLFFVSITAGIAQVPRKISYQAVLTNTSGSPAQDGSYSITFKLFLVPTFGTELFSETHPAVNVERGSFKVQLGSITPLGLPFDQTYYLEMNVTSGPDITSPVTFPRTEFTSVPYALRADTALVANSAKLALPYIDNYYTVSNPMFELVNTGLNHGGYFRIQNIDNNYDALRAYTTGAGSAVKGLTDGLGNAGEFSINNNSSNGSAVYGNTTGTGAGIEGAAFNNGIGVKGTALSNLGVAGYTTSGTGIYGSNNNSNTVGHAGYFNGKIRVTQDLLVDRNLGVGIATPTAKMEINHNSTVAEPQALLYENDNDFARLSFKNNQGSDFWSVAGFLSSTSANSRLNFYSSQVGADVLSLTGNGYVGVGTSSPTARLEVVDNANDANLRVTSSATYGAQFELKPTETGSKSWWLSSVGSAGGARQGNLEFQQHSDLTTPLTLTKLGKVGIGTQTPASLLHIADATNPASITLGVSATAGGFTALLTSLSSVSGGYASLQSLKSAGSLWGDLILNKDGGNVGIGKSNPGYALDVNGTINATNILKNGATVSGYTTTNIIKHSYGLSGILVSSGSPTYTISELNYSFTLNDSAIVIFNYNLLLSGSGTANGYLNIFFDGHTISFDESMFLTTTPGSYLENTKPAVWKFGPGSHSVVAVANYGSGSSYNIKYVQLLTQIIEK